IQRRAGAHGGAEGGGAGGGDVQGFAAGRAAIHRASEADVAAGVALRSDEAGEHHRAVVRLRTTGDVESVQEGGAARVDGQRVQRVGVAYAPGGSKVDIAAGVHREVLDAVVQPV